MLDTFVMVERFSCMW